jgi:hypothetical protein
VARVGAVKAASGSAETQFVPSLVRSFPAVPAVGKESGVSETQFVPSLVRVFPSAPTAGKESGVSETQFVPSLVRVFPSAPTAGGCQPDAIADLDSPDQTLPDLVPILLTTPLIYVSYVQS